MASRNEFDGNRAGGEGHTAERPAMVHDNLMADTVDAAAVDKISGLPDDILLDILGRLVMAGDAHAVARTSTLSRRWRSLPWPHIPSVFLDVGKFIHSDDGDWQRVRRRRRQRFWQQQQHEATAGFTDALARFLAAPPAERVIQTLSLKLILTRRDHLRRIGDLVGAAAGTAAVIRNVEVEIVTKMGSVAALAPGVEEPTKLGDGERLGHFRQDCPGAFRCLTKLTLHELWFHDPAELNELVRGCNALELLSLSSCALTLPAMDDDDGGGGGGGEPPQRPALTIDAPESRLQRLLCDLCLIGGVELVQAPELVALRYRAVVLGDSPPISFGCTPSLKDLCLGQGEEMSSVKLKLSELLVNGGGQLVSLSLMFENSKIWLQPESPKQLRAALRWLKYLNLVNISPECNLSWAMFLPEAAPFLEILDIHISSHICLDDSWHKKGDEDVSLAWEPSPDFRHHHLKQLSVKRAFHVDKDLLFARLVMEFAVNLQAVTLGVKSIGCTGCIGALPKYPDLVRSRLRFTDGSEFVDAFVKELMDGITTSAKITLLLSDGVCRTTAHSA